MHTTKTLRRNPASHPLAIFSWMGQEEYHTLHHLGAKNQTLRSKSYHPPGETQREKVVKNCQTPPTPSHHKTLCTPTATSSAELVEIPSGRSHETPPRQKETIQDMGTTTASQAADKDTHHPRTVDEVRAHGKDASAPVSCHSSSSNGIPRSLPQPSSAAPQNEKKTRHSDNAHPATYTVERFVTCTEPTRSRFLLSCTARKFVRKRGIITLGLSANGNEFRTRPPFPVCAATYIGICPHNRPRT